MSLSDHKDTIQRLYVDEDLTLDELMDSMERNFGIRASKDTYKRYFKKWQLRKNNNHDFYIWANHRIEKRSHANPKKKTQILLNGKAIDKKTIQKNIPRQVSTYDQARAAAASPATPQGYSIVTPAGSTSSQPQDTSARPSEPPSSSHPASLGSDITDNEELTEIKLLAEVMQDCGSFLSLWGQMNVSTSRRNLAELHTSVAERIITDTWDLQSHPRHTTRLLPVLGFDILHSSYKDDFERVQLQLRNLPQDIYADTVRTARFIASAKGCVNAAAALFDNEPNVDSRDSKGQTCLGIAVLHNHPAMVSFLIARGANVNNRRRDGQTVWTQICISEEHETVSQLLINAGADVNTTVNSVNGLYIAAAGGHIDDVQRLLRRGMNPSIQTPFLWAPLVSFNIRDGARLIA
ncbi:ankyrin [Aspergillus costaricaensis CBS 115574]|uniref:Ankyrin n=1 Tax=Aspergillus costaricaensis CBS 115574 TaxID=1448317 RepID=A0ACD1IHQ7_9EURO|nr:ankyrin [Aspergillus costaricaensis CBS 115574]RAK90104.1 ankyrin [Aspergillus costaricaensis CBS 115574]